MHMKKVHRKVENDAVASIVEDPAQYSAERVTINGENVYLVRNTTFKYSLVENSTYVN